MNNTNPLYLQEGWKTLLATPLIAGAALFGHNKAATKSVMRNINPKQPITQLAQKSNATKWDVIPKDMLKKQQGKSKAWWSLYDQMAKERQRIIDEFTDIKYSYEWENMNPAKTLEKLQSLKQQLLQLQNPSPVRKTMTLENKSIIKKIDNYINGVTIRLER